MIQTGYEPTPHRKAAEKKTPTKSDHQHEYYRLVMFAYVRYCDGRISEEKKKFWGPVTCIECGHVRTKSWSDAIEIEVSRAEFRKIYPAKSNRC